MKFYIITALLLFSIFLSCKKEETSDIDKKNLVFESLSANDTIIRIGVYTKITASATGDELSYNWESHDLNGTPYGFFFGSGNQVEWTICHADTYEVICTVKDKFGNSDSKKVRIRTTGNN